MSRKLKIVLILFPSVALLLLAAIYILLSVYYRNGFSYGTWINGVYCTGKGIEEINEELKTKYETTPVKITWNENAYYINPEDIEYSIDFTAYLKDIMQKQNSFLWIKNIFGDVEKTDLIPNFTYNSDELSLVINNLELVKKNTYPEGHSVEIKLGEDGYELIDSNPQRIIVDKLTEGIIDSLYTGKELILDESFFYTEDYSKKEEQLIKNWNMLEPFFSTKIILDMGSEQIPIDKKVLSRFITPENDGRFKLSDGMPAITKEYIKAYVDELLDSYDTYSKKSREFVTSDGEIKEIDLVLYGTLIDHDDMSEFLYDAIINSKEETYTPKYLHEGYAHGLNDIGDTYVEVDMGKQVLYYYKDGELKLKTDVVTGKPSTLTPAMVTSVRSKSRNVTLKGTNYASFVSYWVPIYPQMGIGLHDASWQSAFGGDLYLTRGSHGCINMITDDIAYLYDELEIGVPVICYY